MIEMKYLLFNNFILIQNYSNKTSLMIHRMNEMIPMFRERTNSNDTNETLIRRVYKLVNRKTAFFSSNFGFSITNPFYLVG